MPSSTGTLVFNDQKIQAPDIYATESLGVGVSDPTSNLQVAGNAYVSSNLEIGTANLFVDTTTGRVGVGTGSPLYPFHIHTDTKPQLFIEGNNNSNATLRSGSGPNYRNTYQEIDFGHYAIANRGADNYIDFKVTSGEVAPTTRMRITGEGNVGIGVTNPSAKLDINGYTKNYNSCWSLWHFNTSANSTGTLKFQYHKCTPINCTVNQSGGYYYRVTITVPGRYYIGFSAFSEGNLANATSIELSIRKNGSSQVRSYVNIPATNYYAALSPVTCILDLVVNDYIEIYSTNYLHYNSNGSFYGFLLG